MGITYCIKTNVVFLGVDIKFTLKCWLEITPDKSHNGFAWDCTTVDLWFGESKGQEYDWPQLAPNVRLAITDEINSLQASQLGIDMDALHDDGSFDATAPGGYATRTYKPNGSME